MLDYAPLTYAHLVGFIDELEKRAVSLQEIRQGITGGTAALGKALGSRAAGFGTSAGALAGGAIGGAYKGHQAYEDARNQGASQTDAARQALGAGAFGAAKGMAIGTVGGLAAGTAVGHLAPGVSAAVPKAFDSLTHFGQRQIHGLTGAAPEVAGKSGVSAVRAIGGGAAETIGAHRAAKASLAKANAGHTEIGWGETARRLVGQGTPDEALNIIQKADAAKHLEHMKRWANASMEADKAGLTSVPGYLKGLATRPIDTLRKGIGETWRGSPGVLGRVGVAYGLAMGGMEGVSALRNEELPEGHPDANLSRAERLGRAGGNVLGGVLGSSVPFVGQMALGHTLAAGGRMAGKAVDLGMQGVNKLRGAQVAPPPQQQLPQYANVAPPTYAGGQ